MRKIGRDHLVLWDLVCMYNRGVRNLVSKNMSLLGKCFWHFPSVIWLFHSLQLFSIRQFEVNMTCILRSMITDTHCNYATNTITQFWKMLDAFSLGTCWQSYILLPPSQTKSSMFEWCKLPFFLCVCVWFNNIFLFIIPHVLSCACKVVISGGWQREGGSSYRTAQHHTSVSWSDCFC